MTILVKICGIKNLDSALVAQNHAANFIGFVFFKKSPRNIRVSEYQHICSSLNDDVKKVIVTVDITDYELDEIVAAYKPDYVQCHGSESKSRIEQIRQKYNVKIIKAFSVKNANDIKRSLEYKDVSDIILYDAKATNSQIPGGNGVSFDWDLLKKIDLDFNWMLSGGLNLDNIDEALKVTNAKMIDLSSAVESSPGVKDRDLIKNFLNKVKL